MADIDFLKRRYYVSALGLTEAQAVRMTINDLEYAFFSTASPTISGTGSPEGVVTAPVGTEYIDSAVTNGAMRWAKKTGTGNTGWQCVEGDTGWRDVTATTSSAFESEPSLIRRANNVVSIITALVVPYPYVAPLIGPLFSDGFRPRATYYLPPSYSGGGKVVAIPSGLRVYTIEGTGAVERVSQLWFTDEPWPTTLPGVAA